MTHSKNETKMDRRALLRAAGGGVLALSGADLLIGCGGGGGNGGGGGAIQALMPAEQRVAVLNDVTDKCGSFYRADPATVIQQMAAYMQQHAGFMRAGISPDNSAWGRLNDGTLHVINFNLLPEPDGKVAHIRGLTRSSDSVPSPGAAWVFDGLGPAFTHVYAENIRNIYLPHANYFAVDSPSTPEKLKNVKNASFLLLAGHGGTTGDHGDLVYAIWTSEKISTESALKYATDISAGSVVTMTALENDPNITGQPVETHYSITPKFVRQYMSFTDNSLVLIFACWGNSIDSTDMRQACFERNCALYVGWDNEFGDKIGADACDYLVRKLTYDSVMDPATVAPFAEDWGTIRAEMQAMSPRLDQDFKDGNLRATLQFTLNDRGGKKDFGLLSPSIQADPQLDNQANTFTLTGLFGPDPKTSRSSKGKITVNGVEAVYTSWQPNQIVCKLPADGKGGNVIVSIDGRKSNAVTLTATAGNSHIDHIVLSLDIVVTTVGDQSAARAEARDKDNNVVPATFEIKSDNPAVATVLRINGTVASVKAIAPGMANITATETTTGIASKPVTLTIAERVRYVWLAGSEYCQATLKVGEVSFAKAHGVASRREGPFMLAPGDYDLVITYIGYYEDANGTYQGGDLQPDPPAGVDLGFGFTGPYVDRPNPDNTVTPYTGSFTAFHRGDSKTFKVQVK